MDCCAMYFGRTTKFRRNILPSSSVLKIPSHFNFYIATLHYEVIAVASIQLEWKFVIEVSSTKWISLVVHM
jgi:hypothetical protein